MPAPRLIGKAYKMLVLDIIGNKYENSLFSEMEGAYF